MPEGPTLVALKQEIASFKGKKITEAYGLAKTFDLSVLPGHTIKSIESGGKYLYIILTRKAAIRLHFGMFGSWRINERKETNPRLHLSFAGGEELNFYTTSVKLLESETEEYYDSSIDIMSEDWDEAAALKKLKALPEGTMICDALLNQDLFAGLGNIIKNEILWRVKLQPESEVANIPLKVLRALSREAVKYSFQFLEWRKEGTLKKHWEAHTKKTCPRDGEKLVKKHTGKGERRSFFCTACQVKY